MKWILQKFNKILLAVLGFSILLGTALIFTPTKSVALANADGANAQAHRFFHSDMQGEWESFTDKTSLDSRYPRYRGIRTEIRPANGETDITLTFNGVIHPFTNNNFYFEHLSNDLGVDYSAVVMTYTSTKDPTKQVSFIAMNRNESTYFTVSLTDDLEFDFDKGYAYIANTNRRQPTFGLNRLSGVYEQVGLTGANTSKWGPIWNGDLSYSLTSDGKARPNTGLVCANITDPEYLEKSSEFLTGEYANRYTSDYVLELLGSISDSIFTIRFCDIQKDEFAFHQRILNGTYMDENAESSSPRSTKPYLIQKEDVLYAGETYKVSELVTRYSAYWVDGEDVSYMNFFAGTDVWNDLENGKVGRLGHGADQAGNINNQDVTVSNLQAGQEYKIIFASYVRSGYGQYEGLWGCTQTFTWKVIDKNPTVARAENAYFMRNVEYDLANFFTVTPFFGEANCVYSVDGKVVASGKYTFNDGNEHKLGVVVTDDVGSASLEFTIAEGEILLPSETSILTREGKLAWLAVPILPKGMRYTVSTIVGEKLENSSAIIFPDSGEYVSTYVFQLPFTNQTIERKVVNAVRVRENLTLQVNGTFKESYVLGETLYLPSATISALPTLKVHRQVYVDGVELPVNDAVSCKLEIAGEYVVKYFITVENETLEKEYSFTVLETERLGETVENPEEENSRVKAWYFWVGGAVIGVGAIATVTILLLKKEKKGKENEEN